MQVLQPQAGKVSVLTWTLRVVFPLGPHKRFKKISFSDKNLDSRWTKLKIKPPEYYNSSTSKFHINVVYMWHKTERKYLPPQDQHFPHKSPKLKERKTLPGLKKRWKREYLSSRCSAPCQDPGQCGAWAIRIFLFKKAKLVPADPELQSWQTMTPNGAPMIHGDEKAEMPMWWTLKPSAGITSP